MFGPVGRQPLEVDHPLALAGRRRQRAGTLSGGERQMLVVGRALMSDSKLLMLGEPSLGLAPTVVEVMYDTFSRLNRRGLDHPAGRAIVRNGACGGVLQVGRSVLSGPAGQHADDPQVQRTYLGVG